MFSLKRFLINTRDYLTIKKSRLFDERYYLEKNPDVRAADISALRHYIKYGAMENRNPSSDFDSEFYLNKNVDVNKALVNPLVHYIRHGSKEGRSSRKVNEAGSISHREGAAGGGVCLASFQADQQVVKQLNISERQFFDQVKSAQWIKELTSSGVVEYILREQPLVSIVMPTWNRAVCICKAIDSVISQKYENWELIVIDDGSTDNTLELIKSRYADINIHIISTAGIGVCGARNLGLEAAKGEYIAYLDSDNSWMPNYLWLMLCALLSNKRLTGYAALEVWDTPEAPDVRPWYRQTKFNYESLKNANFIDLNIFMHKAELYKKLGGFDPSLKRMVDWDLIIRYTKDFPPVYANFIGAKYDNNPSSARITNSENLSWLNVIRNRYLIDWNELNETVNKRNINLVSIIICVYGAKSVTEACLESLFKHQAGFDFEIVLVDNGSDRETTSMLERWTANYKNIQLLKNRENYNFALGCNLGFARSSGNMVVFLNNDTEVSPEWLRSLIRPLQECPDIKGTQPKLLYPDGTVQNVGVVFSDRSPLGYPIYVNAPGDFPPTQLPRRYSALTAACFAIRAKDFISMQGFDPIYVNGQEDIDLCLRLGKGEEVYQYVSDSIVIHHEGKTPGRGKHIEANRKIFYGRWHEKIIPNDQEKYLEDNISIAKYVPDNKEWVSAGYAVWRPELSPPAYSGCSEKNVAQTLNDPITIAIKIGCPRADIKDHWGDYHFAVSLAAAFLRRGVSARVDFLNEWDASSTPKDVNLVLRGLSKFAPSKSHVNLMWMISHPKLVSFEELAAYDHIFVASASYAEKLSEMQGISVSSLMQCTDSSRFFPRTASEEYRSNYLFVANSRKVNRLVVQKAIEENVDIDIHGEMWSGFAPESWIKSPKIDNIDLPKYYSSAGLVLNDHWPDMRDMGFVSNRIFDALACGVSVVSDNVAGIPLELLECIAFFDGEDGLRESIKKAQAIDKSRTVAIASIVRNKHSFDNRVEEILSRLSFIKNQ